MLFYVLFACLNAHLVTGQNVTGQSLIIIKIPEINEAQYNDILSGISKNDQFTLEYSSRESEIIVVKYYHNHNEKGDVEVAALSNFSKWAKLSRPELIYVDFKLGSSSRG